MPAARARLRRQVPVDVEEARARNVSPQVQGTSTAGISQLPAAIDELVAQTYQLPAGEGGSGTVAGWITYTIPPVELIHASSNCVRS
jgi:hypothetical protein